MAAKKSKATEQSKTEEKKYIVIKDFTDEKDDNHIYRKDHVYPRNNKKADPKRVEELSTTKNKRKEVLIKEK